jgi:hypothetical protein
MPDLNTFYFSLSLYLNCFLYNLAFSLASSSVWYFRGLPCFGASTLGSTTGSIYGSTYGSTDGSIAGSTDGSVAGSTTGFTFLIYFLRGFFYSLISLFSIY